MNKGEICLFKLENLLRKKEKIDKGKNPLTRKKELFSFIRKAE